MHVLASGSAAYAGAIGLSIGALATPQGSVGTLLAADLSGDAAPRLDTGRLALIAVPATLAAVSILSLRA